MILKKLNELKFRNLSWSQEGEDLILQRLFESKRNGFYVDIGSHHPYRFSNTYWAYRQGWRGINIDPTPNFKKNFLKYRPRDSVHEVGISDSKSELKYYIFNDPALNTFNYERVIEILKNTSYKLVDSYIVPCLPLSKIFELKFKDSVPKIDFMSIDVEGSELAVLKSNDWKKYRSTYLVIEILKIKLIEFQNLEIFKFLKDIEYEPVSVLYNSMILKDKNYENEH